MSKQIPICQAMREARVNKTLLTQAEAADKVGILPPLMGAYEWGRAVPKIDILIALADLYGVTLDELVGRENPFQGKAS